MQVLSIFRTRGTGGGSLENDKRIVTRPVTCMKGGCKRSDYVLAVNGHSARRCGLTSSDGHHRATEWDKSSRPFQVHTIPRW
jgi:hypothetical protein